MFENEYDGDGRNEMEISLLCMNSRVTLVFYDIKRAGVVLAGRCAFLQMIFNITIIRGTRCCSSAD